MEFMKKHMFLPGQVEQWVVINNLSKLSIGDLPRKELGAIIEMLGKNYSYVLGKSWGVNRTWF